MQQRFGRLEQRMPRVLGTQVQMVIDSGGVTSRAFGYRPTEISIAGQRLSGMAMCLFVPSASIIVQGLTFEDG